MRVGLGPAKGKDFATTLGPWLVTADELDGYRDADGFLDLACTATVNGTVVGRDTLAHMGWTFENLVAYASRDSRVVPGDMLASGTVGNGGCLAELWGRAGRQDPPPLRAGDVVTLAVQGIGAISNRVTTGPTPPALPSVHRRNPATRG
jgi:2-keto-4-pentenoate hydratase/2-oxohepta-3-ene-1,7-dioic acid hydratase in catechol pathway